MHAIARLVVAALACTALGVMHASAASYPVRPVLLVRPRELNGHK